MRFVVRSLKLLSVLTVLGVLLMGPATDTAAQDGLLNEGILDRARDAAGVGGDDAGEGGGIQIKGSKPVVAGKAFGSVGSIISNGFNIVIAVSAVVFVVLILIGGVMYLTSFGNDEQTKKAKTLLLDAVVGLVIVVTAWAVGNYVLKLLGLTIT